MRFYVTGINHKPGKFGFADENSAQTLPHTGVSPSFGASMGILPVA
jgi:hypothetical protein